MERKVGLIPKVMMKGAMGPKEYGVLVTDQRTIFALEKASKAALVGVLGDALLSSRKTVDYETAEPEALAADADSIVVPHSQLQRLTLKKGFSSYTLSSTYTLLLDYGTPEGRTKKLKAFLVPPSELIAEKKRQGISKEQVHKEYAQAIQRAFQEALPASAALRAEWSL